MQLLMVKGFLGCAGAGPEAQRSMTLGFRAFVFFRIGASLVVMKVWGSPADSCWSFLSSSRRHLSSCSCPRQIMAEFGVRFVEGFELESVLWNLLQT